MARRFFALTILTVGLLPSMLIAHANAIVPNQVQLQRHCRERLGFGPTEPLYGPLLLQLRRCIDNTESQYEHASRLMRRSGVPMHYAAVNRETFTRYRKETQRSLNTRIQLQERNRLRYYRTVDLRDRDTVLDNHRRSRRIAVQDQQEVLLRQNRDKYLRWKRAVQACRIYSSDVRQECVSHELNRASR